MKKIHPLNKIKLAGTIIGVIALALVVGIKAPDYAKASANNNVHGYLWSDMPTGSETNTSQGNQYAGRGFGYVSMNSDDPGMSGNYGVSIDMATGELSGQAYSEWNEWLDFDAAGPFPPYNAATSAKVMPSCWADAAQDFCNVIGWARFNGGTDPQSGGWDGWVSLNSDIPPVYHVAYQKSTGNFQGKAWGGTDTGWIDFDNVTSDIDPTLVPPPLSCADPVTGTAYTYTDPANPPIQCAYTPGMSVCYSEPGHIGHFYPAGSTPPSICVTTPPPLPDLCINPGTTFAGTQSILPVFINGTWYNDPNNDGYCTKMPNPPVIGCTNPQANNYNPLAVIDDGSCTFDGTGDPGGPIKPIYKEN